MDRVDYAVVRLRYMYRDDPIMDALYRGEINWGDIPDDDKPLELISWKESVKETKERAKERASEMILPSSPSWSSPTWSPWKKPDTCMSPLIKMSEFPSISESFALPPPAGTKSSSVYTFEKKAIVSKSSTPIHTMEKAKEKAKEKEKKVDSPKSVPGKRTLFIHDLPPKTTVQDISGYFGKYGSILSVTLPKHTDKTHPQFGLSKGFGHIRFEKPEDALAAFTKEKTQVRIHNKRAQIEFVKNGN